MTEYKELPADTEVSEIVNGDRLTFTQPREGETIILFASKHRDGRMGVILAAEFVDITVLLTKEIKLVKIERPVLALPKEPGYYESAAFPISSDCYAYRLTASGSWLDHSSDVGEDYMRVLMPLTRLVPETEAAPVKLADRLDLRLLGVQMDSITENGYSTYDEDAAALVALIDSGELDK